MLDTEQLVWSRPGKRFSVCGSGCTSESLDLVTDPGRGLDSGSWSRI